MKICIFGQLFIHWLLLFVTHLQTCRPSKQHSMDTLYENFQSINFSCQVEFSPFEDDKLAVATAQHFGIIGNGRQYVLEVDKDENTIDKVNSFDTRKNLNSFLILQRMDYTIVVGMKKMKINLFQSLEMDLSRFGILVLQTIHTSLMKNIPKKLTRLTGILLIKILL